MLPALIGLVAQLAPDVIGLFSKDKGEVATKAIGAATSILETLTGKTGQEALDLVGASPELQLEFKKALMADRHIEEQMRLADVADARDMFKHNSTLQTSIADLIMGRNLYYVVGLIVCNSAIVMFTPQEYMAAVAGISNIIGMVVNSLLKERQDVVGFAFGSSMGSKEKDAAKRGVL